MQSRTLIALIIGSIIIGFTFFVATYKPSSSSAVSGASPDAPAKEENTVVMENGKQVITLRAKGGYWPRVSVAKAGIPTVLRVKTDNTFDCSSALRIPSLKIAQNLQYSGSVDIDLGSQKAGILDGMCSMGMYRFGIEFRD